MKSFKKPAALGMLTVVSAAILTACGGGGGSAGQVSAPYTIHLSAEKNVDGTPKVRLPLNLQRQGPRISGVHGPFTTTLYVDVRKDGKLVESKEDSVACNVYPSGLEIGALYYLNGDDKEDDDGNILGSRQLALDAPSATFHFHASDTAGTATVRCSVQDPRDGQTREASIDITVGNSTGTPSDAYIETTNTSDVGFMFTQSATGATVGAPKQVVLQTAVFDDFNQPVPNPANYNVYAQVVGGTASDVTLRGAGVVSTGVYAATVNGRATFTAVSGEQSGWAFIRVVADRADNDVTNGIQQPIATLNAVRVLADASELDTPTALSVEDATLSATVGQPFSAALLASGGRPPYKWSLASGSTLPAGLSLSSEGVISGTPTAAATNHTFTARVEDNSSAALGTSGNQVVTKQYTINVQSNTSALSLNCGLTTATDNCTLNSAIVGLPYLHLMTANGGTGTYQWSATNLPSFLSLNQTTGAITGNPTCSDLAVSTNDAGETVYADRDHGFYLTVTSGTDSVMTVATVNVQRGSATCP